jgi:hypothetical protein
MLSSLTRLLELGREKKIFCPENPFMIQLMIVSTLVNYQTTAKLRHRVLQQIDISVSEAIQPDIEDILPNLKRKIIRALSC